MSEVAGLDVGSRAIKLVVRRQGEVILSRRLPTTFDPAGQLRELFANGLPERLAVTGYGRELARELYPQARTVTEIKAHALGAASLFPQAATLLDIGGQDTKAIALLPGGRVGRFEMNDRCAAGTGKFLEYVATAFGLSVAANIKDDNVTGSASASYRVAESLKLGVDLSRRNRPDMGNQTENMIMFELKGTFP